MARISGEARVAQKLDPRVLESIGSRRASGQDERVLDVGAKLANVACLLA